jgi:hypothetical protein
MEFSIYPINPQILLKFDLGISPICITIIIIISDKDVIKAIKHLKPSKAAGVDDIPGFIIKGCTDIFVPVLKRIFQPYGSKQQLFLFSKKAKVPLLAITGQYPFRIIFPKYFVIYDHVSLYLKFKISPYQHGFSKTKLTSTNLVT